MNAAVHVSLARWSLAVIALFLASTTSAQSPTPSISRVRAEGTNLVVTATVPAGIQRITLETSDRLNRAWAPRAVLRPRGESTVVTFRVPLSRPVELIRIRVDATEPVPASFFEGTNSFSAPSSQATREGFDMTTGPNGGVTPGGGSARDVVESDIWKVQGNTLYFFNHYRGLQVIDITNPDSASVRGSLELPAAGDQMYLLGSDRVVLLARDGCNYDQSQILLVVDAEEGPKISARLPVPGTITESRLVGNALYVTSQTSRPVTGTTNTVWEWGTLVSAFDLDNPDAPGIRNTLWYPGYANVVSATDTFLFVVTQSPVAWWQSVVNVIDITDPAGAMVQFGAITNRGQVPDKFKLNYNGQVFSAISENRQQSGGQLVTRLETFQLPDPRSGESSQIVKLGELELGHGERLHATRFDGDRAYIVTFFQIDPLWIIDLSNPRVPRIAGSVEVPGWSTYIQPLGNRLVTLGIETNHVAVSLYDVANPAAPSRLSQVRLGANYSWSEANYDEKAFAVLPDAGLILVPFSGDTTNGYSSALQLIDFSPAMLRARGQVRSPSGLSYRRATVFKERILSLNDWELVSVDARDRDNPIVSARLELAESVDRLILAGEYLLRLSAGNGWDISTPVLSIASVRMPDRALSRCPLLSLPLLGAARRGDLLYLAQGTPGAGDPGAPADGSAFALTVFTLTNLPSATLVSQSITNLAPIGWSRDWQALWPRPDVLVWAGGQDSWWWCDYCPLTLGGGLAGSPDLFWRPYWRSTGGNGHLVAFDARRPESPHYGAQVDLTSTNVWSFSGAFAADSLVYVSHQTSQYVPDPVQTNSGRWIYQSFLDVVDFANPGDPLVREPVNIPNPLAGVAGSGALLFTLGSHWTQDPNTYWTEYLDASAYDGVSAHLVDSLPLPSVWPHPILVLNTNVIVGHPGINDPTNAVAPALETWTISNSGKFARLGSLRLGSAVSDLSSFPGLLAATDVNMNVGLFDATDLAALRAVGSGKGPLCWWWPDLGHSDGSLSAGLWVPLNAYGLTHISPADNPQAAASK